MCFDFLHNFVWNIHILRITKRDKINNVNWFSRKVPFILWPFNDTWIFLKFSNTFKYEISWKSIQWEPSCSARTAGYTGRHDEASSRFSQLCGSLKNVNTNHKYEVSEKSVRSEVSSVTLTDNNEDRNSFLECSANVPEGHCKHLKILSIYSENVKFHIDFFSPSYRASWYYQSFLFTNWWTRELL